VGRVANGIPRRVDRLRGLGNAVVPQVAEYVGRMVIDILVKQSLQSP
jgi:DNA (cytosine-5)-methyltransferase 1